MRTVSDVIATWLAEKEITHAFGIVGGGNVSIFEAIAKLGKTEIIACHHEQAASMASTYFNRIRGSLESVVLVTTGAGSTNAITGVMAAWMDRIPLLVISGNEASKYMGKKTRIWGVQGYGSSELAQGFTQYAGRLIGGKETYAAFDILLSIANRSPKGPVWIDIPKDMQNAMV